MCSTGHKNKTMKVKPLHDFYPVAQLFLPQRHTVIYSGQSIQLGSGKPACTLKMSKFIYLTQH